VVEEVLFFDCWWALFGNRAAENFLIAGGALFY
jgi:hypothetical protein